MSWVLCAAFPFKLWMFKTEMFTFRPRDTPHRGHNRRAHFFSDQGSSGGSRVCADRLVEREEGFVRADDRRVGLGRGACHCQACADEPGGGGY